MPGNVVNTATASGSGPGGTSATSPPSTTVTPTVAQPELSVNKIVSSITDTNGNGVNDAGDIIIWMFEVRNIGNVPVTNITLQDTLPGIVESGGPIPVLQPGGQDTTTFSATYTIMPSDVPGNVGNSATVSGSGPGGTTVTSPSSSTVTPTTALPSLALTKSVGSVVDANGNGITDAGDVINWVFEVRNTGNVTLTGVAVTDLRQGVVVSGSPISSLAPGAQDTTTYTATYTIQQSDVPGSVVNQAYALGTAPGGAQVVSAPSSTSTPTTANPGLTLVKSVASIIDTNNNGINDAGDVIRWSFNVLNDGNVPVTNITLTDPLPGILITGGPISTLAPSAQDTTTFSATYTIQQNDVPGNVVNSATVAGVGPSGTPVGSPPSSTTTPTVSQPSMTLTKTIAGVADNNGNGYLDAGDVISWTFDVHNTGNVPITNVTVSDTLPGVVLVGGPIASIAAGAHDTTTFTATYTVQQSDVPGNVVNVATASGAAPGGSAITTAPSSTTLATTSRPDLTIVKTVSSITDTNGNGVNDAGDVISWSFLIRNDGNVPVSNIVLADTLAGVVINGGPIPTLAPGAQDTTTYTASYVIRQADVPGAVLNAATVSGLDPAGTVVDSAPSFTTTPTVAQPSLALTKSVASINDTNGNGINDAGDVINWTFDVHNTGNIPIEDITLNDQLLGVIVTGGPIAILNPGAHDTTTFSARYTIRDTDVPGTVVNTAVVDGEDRANNPIASPPSSTSTPTTAQPSLQLTKSVSSITDTNGNGITDAGDVINWSFVVRNDGNVSLTNIAVTDTLPGVTLTGGPIATLAAGEQDSSTFTASYVIQMTDVPGQVINSATATGDGPAGAAVSSPPSTTTTPTVAQPGLTLTKTVSTVTDTNGNGVNDAGDVINWTFDVRNTGNVALSNITVNDVLPGVVVTGGPIATLAPAAQDTSTFTASYTVQQADVPGNVVNSATASANGPAGTTATSPPSTTSTPTVAQPSLTVTKAVASITDTNSNGINDAGDVIRWSFDVRNTGNVPMTNVSIADTLPGVVVVGGPIATLAAGASDTSTFSASYAILQSDVPGDVVNTATVSGSGPQGTTTVSPPSTTTTPTVSQPSLVVTKSVASIRDTNGNGANDAGDVITWAFDVRNTGNVPLTNVSITDTLPGVVLTGGPIASLAPGATDATTFSASYTILQSDIPGNVVNVATASADAPGGTITTSPPSSTTTPTSAQPKIALIKEGSVTVNSNNDGRVGSVGDEIDYRFTVINVGNVPLTNITVSDNLVAVSGGPLATLAPGESDSTTFSARYLITQADVDSGQIVNTATANGTGAGGVQVSDVSDNQSPAADNPTVTTLAQEPAIEVTKNGVLSIDGGTPGKGNVGDVVAYSVSIRNIGNVTIERLETTDTLDGQQPTTLNCAPTRLLPGQVSTCDQYSHTITQADVDGGANLVNRVAVNGFSPRGQVSAGNQFTIDIDVVPVVLRVTKSAAPRDVRVGDLVRYTVQVENLSTRDAVDVTLTDTPPAGFTYVDGSLTVSDQDGSARLAGTYPIRVDQLDIPATGSATLTYLLRVGAGVRSGIHVNSAYAQDGNVTSNTARAEVQLVGDPLIDETLVLGTVYDDRDRDGWQDAADLSDVKVKGGFAPEAYVPGSTTVDRGAGMQPEPDASAPLLHGLELGSISARQSDADPVEAHRITIRQKLTEAKFTDDFILTSRQGLSYRMTADGQVAVERTGDSKKGLTGADLKLERKVSQAEGGVLVDYVITNHGVDERGIPGVRIASVEGIISETDQFGRYHIVGIPGGPWERGRNFILKVDTATLPEGVELTTANPLMRRITPGIPVRFDWGAKLPNGLIEGGTETFEAELGTFLFDAGSSVIRPGAEEALERVATHIREHSGGEVFISANGENTAFAYERAQSVQEALRQRAGAEDMAKTLVTLRADLEDSSSDVMSLGPGPILREVFFDTDKTAIKVAYVPIIEAIAADVEKMQGGVVSIVGHADRRASDAYNIDLAMRRSRAVFDAISRLLSPAAKAKLRVEVSNDPSAALNKGGALRP